MDPTCLVLTVQAGGGGVMVWGRLACYTLSMLIPINHRLIATAFLSIVADHVPHDRIYLLMVTSSLIMYQTAKIITNWFQKHNKKFSDIQCLSVSLDVNLVEQLWESRSMKVWWKNLQELHDAILKTWINRKASNILWTPCHDEFRLFWEHS